MTQDERAKALRLAEQLRAWRDLTQEAVGWDLPKVGCVALNKMCNRAADMIERLARTQERPASESEREEALRLAMEAGFYLPDAPEIHEVFECRIKLETIQKLIFLARRSAPQQEPVGWTDERELSNLDEVGRCIMWKTRPTKAPPAVALYDAAPPAAPDVRDALLMLKEARQWFGSVPVIDTALFEFAGRLDAQIAALQQSAQGEKL